MTIENEYGCCPVCGMNDGYLNLGDEHWFYCRDHMKKWIFGSGFFNEPGANETQDGIPAETFLTRCEEVPMRMTWP